jgi:hypothetical protein
MSEYHATKYDSARDEVIALLSDELEGYGMRDDTSGDSESPTGFFALVVIPADGIDPVNVTGDDYARFTADAVANEYGVTPAEVAGVHIVTHNSQGFVSVETFGSEAEAREEFDCRAGRYAEWSDEDRDEDSDGVYVCPVAGHGYHSL